MYRKSSSRRHPEIAMPRVIARCEGGRARRRALVDAGPANVIIVPMWLRVRKLAVMLLALVVPWAALAAAAMQTAHHHDDATAVDARAAGPHDARVHHAGTWHLKNDGAAAAQARDPATDAERDTCTDAGCFVALAAPDPVRLVAANGRGWMIPFATWPLLSCASDCLERPPRNSHV